MLLSMKLTVNIAPFILDGYADDENFLLGLGWSIFRCGLLVSGCVSGGVCLVLRRHGLDSM